MILYLCFFSSCERVTDIIAFAEHSTRNKSATIIIFHLHVPRELLIKPKLYSYQTTPFISLSSHTHTAICRFPFPSSPERCMRSFSLQRNFSNYAQYFVLQITPADMCMFVYVDLILSLWCHIRLHEAMLLLNIVIFG